MATPVSKLLYAGFRIAGVTDRPGRTPSTAQFGDAIDILNRMIGSWNCDRLKIYSQAINAYPLVAGQKAYTLGGAVVNATNLSTTRPVEITNANIIVNTTSPVVREPLAILDDDLWAAIQVQDITGTIPWSIYNDGAHPISTISLIGQPLTTYQLELYTWAAIPTFAAITDSVILPPGYEHAITFNLGVLIAQNFPTQANMAPESAQTARDALMAIESVNAPSPIMQCDSAVLNAGRRRRGGDYFAYLGNNW